MIVFAWILWSVFLLTFSIKTAIIFCGICAINEGRKVNIKADLLGFLFDVACFVFLSIYLFA